MSVAGARYTGNAVRVITQSLGTDMPAGASLPSLVSPIYFDVLLQGFSAGTATVCITNDAVTQGHRMHYWAGGKWVEAANKRVTGNTICADIDVSNLNGTPIVIGT